MYLPQDRLLYTGDVAFLGVMPAAMDGHITSWARVLAKSESLHIRTVVPGHGYLGTEDDLATLRGFLGEAISAMRQQFQKGASQEQALKELPRGKLASWLGQERLTALVDRAYKELRGELS